MKTELLRRIKGYDEKFKLYYTENDLCLRIKKLGYEIMHVGDVKVHHTVSASVKKLNWKRIDMYYDDLLLYYKKHGYGVSGTMLYCLLKCEEQVLKLLRP